MANRKLRVAVQLYGHLRTFEQTAPALRRHVLERYDCDVFLHTWSVTQHGDPTWYSAKALGRPKPVDAEVRRRVDALYQPRALRIDEQNFFQEEGSFGTHPTMSIGLKGLRYMAHSQHAANRLRLEYQEAHGIAYDYVIVTRPDVQPFIDLDLAAFAPFFAYHPRSSLHLVHSSEVLASEDRFLFVSRLSDCFYLSTPDVVSDIAQFYRHFDRIYRDINQVLPKGVDAPEAAFLEWVQQASIVPRVCRFYYALVRREARFDVKTLPPSEVLPRARYFRGATPLRAARFLRQVSRNVARRLFFNA